MNVDLVFVLDVSKSIGNNTNFQTVTQFARDVIQFLDIGLNDSLVGVILFARHANVHFHAQQHTSEAELVETIDSIIYDEIPLLNRTGTNIPEALDLLRTAGETDGALRLRENDLPKIVIFITDGRANTKDLTGNSREEDAKNTKDAAVRLRDSKIYDQIYAVGIKGNKEVNFEELYVIASDHSLVHYIDDFNQQQFDILQQNLKKAVCGHK